MIAITNTGTYVVYHKEKKLICQYASLPAAERGEAEASCTYTVPDGIVQLVAYETGFAALSARGDVTTWGDERYCACLGREPTHAR